MRDHIAIVHAPLDEHPRPSRMRVVSSVPEHYAYEICSLVAHVERHWTRYEAFGVVTQILPRAVSLEKPYLRALCGWVRLLEDDRALRRAASQLLRGMKLIQEHRDDILPLLHRALRPAA